MKKIIFYIFLLIITFNLYGCKKTANQEVSNFFNQYNNLTDNIMISINNTVDKEQNISLETKKLYKEVLKKQYSNLSYNIINEKYNGDEAIITVNISVFDYYQSIFETENLLRDNPEVFNKNGDTIDYDKLVQYKLNKMNLIKEKIDYTLDIYLLYTSEGWNVENLSDTDLEKINGTYNYLN